ncbi:hypothetical protein BDB00DRAFT_394244 [Zychaea mexicana]|uniref:uncharacterized protein n=1 Tax=Zychaea mexicana TaxID=64656 RepID=UPI0022FE5F63|nr:uncharacterized protein BDB00DRAFT_394244 [Zychaea mexicana]KAI9498631.1 hypothetical protein BDB00DRAFT_394244 [Zychaea mexicana]
MTYRSSADLSRSSNYQQQYHDNSRAFKRKSAETAGSRFMRSISSSFRTTTSNSTKTVAQGQETPPQSSKSSTVFFPDHAFSSVNINDDDSGDPWSSMRIKAEENASSISMQSVSQRSTASTSSTSSPKNPIRTFFGSATMIVRHGRDHQVSPSSKVVPVATKQQQRSSGASNISNGHNYQSMHSMSWRQLFTPGLMRKSSKYEGSFLDEDSSSSSAASSCNNRRSFTSDHMAETVKLYSSQERQRWSCGDDAKYSPFEIAKHNSMYPINSRNLMGEERCERQSAAMRLSNGSEYQRSLHPAISTMFYKEPSEITLSTTTRSESSDNMNGRDTSRQQKQLGVEHFGCEEPAMYRRSFSDDDDDLELLTMGTYGPLTPVSVPESPTTQSSPTADLKFTTTNSGDGPGTSTVSPRSGSTAISQKEDTNFDRISTRSSSYFSARSFSSYSSLHSAKSNSQSRIFDLEMARYHYTNGDDHRRRSSIIIASPLSLSPDTDDNDRQQQVHTTTAALDDGAIEPATTEPGSERKNTRASNNYATISSLSAAQKQQTSTLLSKAMIFAEGRSSSEEQRQAVSSSSSYRSVGTIGISSLSSVLARHWAPHRRTASIQGNKTSQSRSSQQQRRSPIPFSTSDPDMGSNSDTIVQSVNNASRDTLYRSLDIENRIDFTQPSDELNYVSENGHAILITQPVAGDKQKVIAGTGAQLFKKLIESAIHVIMHSSALPNFLITLKTFSRALRGMNMERLRKEVFSSES